MSIVFVATATPDRMLVDTWRSMWPAAELARRGHDSYYLGVGGDTSTRGWAYRDTVIVHATNQDVGLSGLVGRLKGLCRQVFVSFDDDYRSLHDMQSVRERQPVAVGAGDLGFMGWYGQLKADHVQAIRRADGLIAATPAVAGAYSQWAHRTDVIRNYLPAWVLTVRRRPLSPPVVGWHGFAGGHDRDIRWLGAEAKRLRRFGVIGDPDGVIARTGTALAYHRGEQTWRSLYHELGRFSAAVVPVVDDAFNASKSWIKPVEYAAMGVGSVVPVWNMAYREARAHGLPLRMVDTAAGMVDAANAMLDDPFDPDYLRNVVREQFTMEGAGGDAWEAWAAMVGAR